MVSRTDFDLYLKTKRGIIKPQQYNGIVYLQPNEDFEIVCVNKSSLRVKAKYILSGENIGVLALASFQTAKLRKPVEGVDRQFRYCEFGSNDAFDGKLHEQKRHSDEITVVFSPEKISHKTRNL